MERYGEAAEVIYACKGKLFSGYAVLDRFQNGDVEYEIEYKNGKNFGWSNEYYPNGQLKEESLDLFDYSIEFYEYDENGTRDPYDITTGDKKGKRRNKDDYTGHENYSLIKTRHHFEDNLWDINGKKGTFKKVDLHEVNNLDQATHKGIDMIMEFSNPPPKYFIMEVKHTKEAAKLNKTVTSTGGSQMQRAWIRGNLNKAIDDMDMIDEILSGYSSLLVHVKKDYTVVTKSIEYNASKLMNWDGIVLK